ncbi:LysR substrate-binding domain-containing protein [Mycolicibacterium vaccae]|jgi:DNA-binding transcriptional LysR family regulator|uniref:Probable hydrogen peroxide-inducible genes activator n=1 Tax=Mycolicibacterium vaccae ATCC 25954 TaxID=1194972 RepID=K0V6F8_MYCVA|nr:LysR substrate-binding domain-containing protein [Mycolicibacterium vaccae]ANI42388.1 LysR family transcriptional regulator [Mycolicibacterium vaccae 95051]EJZ10353.1 LysR family transcriptional regulator [Mycolicibacterium vaccae ATCC 25954]MCV7060244.1 LysR family transcriptional regulator [Mycolicibacterium vaccae]
MELRHLRYFQAVAEELHFGRAAERLHIAQPPLSQQIRQLEREVGVRLLDRSTRSVALTAAGRAFLDRTIRILGAVDEACDQARRIADGVEGQLVVGCVGSATYSLLPRLVRELRVALPGVDLRVRGEMLATAQLAALHSKDIDLALMRPPVDDPAVTTETLRHDRLLIALPAGHRFAERTEIAMTDLHDEDFISHAGHGRSRMSTLVAGLCLDAGFRPRIRHEVEETSTLVTLVAAGLGVAVVPEPTAALEISGVCYRPLAGPGATVALLAAYPTADASPLIANVVDVLRATA